jgi:hypothetical protein
LVSREKLLTLYAVMVKCRTIAQDANHGRGPCASGLAEGWEATIAGITTDLAAGDVLVAPPGIEEVFSAVEIESGPSEGKTDKRGTIALGKAEQAGVSGSEAGAEFDKARHLARAFHSSKNGRVAVLFTRSPSDMEKWRTRLPDVARRNLPLLIVSHRGTGVGTTLARETARNHATGTLVFGIPVLTVDGADPLAVYRVASESIFRARQRRGPTLIECVLFPAHDLVAPSIQNCRHAEGIDPIESMEHYLVAKGILTPALKGEIAGTSGREPDRASHMLLH